MASCVAGAGNDVTYVLKNPRAGTYVRLTSDEYFLVGLMDGTRQTRELVLAYLGAYRKLALQKVLHVVDELRSHGFLTDSPRDAWREVADALERRTLAGHLDTLARRVGPREVVLRGTDSFFDSLFRWGGRVLVTPPALALLALLGLIGSAWGAWVLAEPDLNPLGSGGALSSGLVVLLALSLGLVSVHEAAHGLATKAYGREVTRGGFLFYYGMPTVFVDTSDMWLEPKGPRIATALAGVISVAALSGLLVCVAALFPAVPLRELANRVAFIALVSNLVNLLPLLELDGYYILVDLLDMPLLRPRAFAFLRGELGRRILQRKGLNRTEWTLAVFGVGAALYSTYAVLYAVQFWTTRASALITPAASLGDLMARIVLVALVVLFLAPLVLTSTARAVRMARELRWRATRRRWSREDHLVGQRRDARHLIDGLWVLAGLLPSEREQLAHHLVLRKHRSGEAVVREGDDGDVFYLIRSGETEVVKRDASGENRRLAVLRRGDYFGELALLTSQPRAATVRARTRLETLTLSRTEFNAVLAPHLRAHGVTLRRIEERCDLARCSLFSEATSSEIDPLLERLTSELVPAGTTIVRQGEPGDRFYLIRRGRVEVVAHNEAGVQVSLGILGPGDYFGELALLDPAARRSATVRTLEDAALWSLDRAGFQELLAQRLQLASRLTATAGQRLSSTRLRLTAVGVA